MYSNEVEEELPEEIEMIVIGSGFAGSSCASLLIHDGVATRVLELYNTPGGVAHG